MAKPIEPAICAVTSDEQERRPKGRANALAVGVDLRFAEVAVDEDAEFVAAQTREQDALVGDVLQPAPGLDEHLIARDMAIDVVHRLEAVEIDDADDEALSPRAARRSISCRLAKN